MKDNYDTSNSTYLFKDGYSKKSLKDAKELMDGTVRSIEDIQEHFKNYYYDYRDKERDWLFVNSTFPKELKGTGTKIMT